ncbi:MAG TPA: efflux transporter outer membrane subunit [Xanthomonadales bacterium]|nr:efflux transporter outer membrane subunit [Xanthomonadales bacterium]
MLLSLFIGALLAGCAVTPAPDGDAIRSDALQGVALREDWVENAPDGDVTGGWLATFDDPALPPLVAEALAANPDQRAAQARIEKAAANLAVAQGYLRPAVGLFAGTSTKAGSDSGGLTGTILSASWELDLWGRLRYGRNARREELAATQADYAFARQLLAARVVQTWYTTTQIRLQRDLARSLVEAAEQGVTLAEKRKKVGVGLERDVVLAQASANQYRDAAVQLDLAYDQSGRALELLLGRYPAAEIATPEDLPSPPADVPAGQPMQMLERRPDLFAAERRVAAAFDRVGEAKAARLPSIALTASGSWLESDVLEFKSDYDNPGVGLAARLVAPIYQGGSLKAQVDVRTAEQREALASYATAALAAIGDVENALNATRLLEQRRIVLELASQQNARALALEQKAYEVGRNDMRDVIRQRVALFGSQTALLAVRGDQLVQRVNLYLALGGSFEAAQAPADDRGAEGGEAVAAASEPVAINEGNDR